jgi:hypothetical protein
MPYTKTYADNGKGLHKRGAGIVTGAEILAVALRDADDPEICRGLRYALLDFSETAEMRMTVEDMHRIVAANRKAAALTPGGVVAVVSPTQMTYGMSRVWHALSSDFGWNSNLFRNRADAVSWLRQQLPSGDDPAAFPSLNGVSEQTQPA